MSKYIATSLHSTGGHRENRKAHQAGNHGLHFITQSYAM